MYKLFFLFTATFLLSTAAFGQSGSLDSTFDEDGIVITDIGVNSSDILYNITIQPDQKILAVGSVNIAGNLDFAVIRYLPDGTLDPDFGENGVVRVDFNSGDDACHAIALQPDGKIVLAGVTQLNNLADFAVARINVDGSLDSTFGVAGKVISALSEDYDFANAVAVQTDGKIIAAGRVNYPGFSSSDFAMIRYTEGGAVDSAFGVNGIVITNIHEEDEVQGIVLQPAGKIVLAGFASISAKGDYAMVRYLEDGSEDKSFGIGGRVITDLEGTGNSDFETCVISDKDGKIVLGGSANYNPIQGTSDVGIVRYDQDGHLDQGFGQQGIYILQLGGNSQLEAIAQQPDRKYVFAGKSDAIGFKNQWLLGRIKNEGGLDTIFGDQGIVVTDMAGNTNEVANSIAVQNDSRIVVGGIPGDFTKYDFTLARYIADFLINVNIESGISCKGIADAIISVDVSGGVPPYFYSLNGVNFQSSPLFNNLGAGDFTITVHDSNGAGVYGSYGPIHIDDAPPPPPVEVDVTENSITITVDGSGTYSYSIDGGSTFQPDNTFSNLPEGTYEVYVIDLSGCIIYFGEVVVQSSGVKIVQTLSFSVAPNPCHDFVTIFLDKSYSDVTVILADLSGKLISSNKENPDAHSLLNMEVSGLTPGYYNLWLKCDEKWGRASFIKQ